MLICIEENKTTKENNNKKTNLTKKLHVIYFHKSQIYSKEDCVE
jgi:hypothetical protein